MQTVTVSPKFQVVIPKEVRRQVPLHTGQKLTVAVKQGIITFLPDRPITAFRGFLKGMKIGPIREKRDRM
jgi:AbrB family looped-hinge helix DNA binding protein